MATNPYYVVPDATWKEHALNSLTCACVRWQSSDGVNGRILIDTGAPNAQLVDGGVTDAAGFAAFLAAFKNAQRSAPLTVDWWAGVQESGTENQIAMSVNGVADIREDPTNPARSFVTFKSWNATPFLVDLSVADLANALNIAANGAP